MYDFPAVCYLDLKFCLMSKAHHISFFFIVKNAREIVKLLRVGYLKKAETTLSRIPTLKKSAFCWGLSQPCLSWGRNRYEPTAPLPEDDSENLLNLVRELKSKGMSIVFISHKLGEVLNIADTITILRDGQTVESRPAKEFTQDTLVSGMVGRELNTRFEKRDCPIGDVALRVSNWSAYDGINNKWIVQDISFEVHQGEVVGLAGMIGAGRTELAMSIFGALEGEVTGKLEYMGKERPRFKNASEAIKAGVFYSSEDRKQLGLILTSGIAYNASLSSLDKYINKGIFITTSDFTKEANEYATNLSHTIILINGKQLTKLMIEYNVGVQINYSYDIKKIDNDYFEMI